MKQDIENGGVHDSKWKTEKNVHASRDAVYVQLWYFTGGMDVIILNIIWYNALW